MDGREFLRAIPVQLLQQPFSYVPTTRQDERSAAKRRLFKANRQISISTPIAERRQINYIGHIVMNLPDSAIEFLDELRGLFGTTSELKEVYASDLPMVHVHCFTRSLERDEARKDIVSVSLFAC
jgi:tRNA (guanine37-N1)-methyltransferase